MSAAAIITIMQKWVADGAAAALSKTTRTRDQLITDLEVPHRAKDAYWALLGMEDAKPIFKGLLDHDDAQVRTLACRALDHLLEPEDIGLLVRMLDDPAESVRAMVIHTLICEHCKEDYCAPEAGEVLARSLDIAVKDPSARVRAMAVEALGAAVHSNSAALEILKRVAETDPSAANRKKAKWYLPGGAIYQRTAGTRG